MNSHLIGTTFNIKLNNVENFNETHNKHIKELQKILNIEISDSWKTHIPVIKEIMEKYKPDFVLELGIGDYSTPTFLKYNINYTGIDNNLEWVDYMKNKYNRTFIFHKVDDRIKIGTSLKELLPDDIIEIKKYYNELDIPDKKVKLLFVDQFTALRTLSINELKNKFDIIIYHDCEPAGIICYNYDLIDMTNFNNTYYKTNTSWTGVMIRINKPI